MLFFACLVYLSCLVINILYIISTWTSWSWTHRFERYPPYAVDLLTILSGLVALLVLGSNPAPQSRSIDVVGVCVLPITLCTHTSVLCLFLTHRPELKWLKWLPYPIAAGILAGAIAMLHLVSPGNIIVLHLTMIGVCFMIKSLHVFVFAYNYHKHRMSGANNLSGFYMLLLTANSISACCMLLGLATLLILRSASSKAATKTSNDIFLASILMQYVCILAFIWESLQSLYHRTRAPSSSVGPVLESGGDPVMDLP